MSTPYFTLGFIVISLVANYSTASFIRGTSKHRDLQERIKCTKSKDVNDCVDNECSYCEFNELFDPVCLPTRDVGSLPPGFFTCQHHREEVTIASPSQEPTSKRNPGSNGFDMLNTEIPSSFKSTSPSTSPSIVSSSSPSRSLTNPSSTPTSKNEDQTESSCYVIPEELSCVDQACAWCEFINFDIEPLCLKKRDISSLPVGQYECNVRKDSNRLPTQEPTEERKGGPGLYFTSSTPSVTPTLLPSDQRNGAPPVGNFDPFERPSSRDVFSCHDVEDETRCREEACKWCEFDGDVLPATCLNAIDITSLPQQPPGFYTCT